MPHVRCHCGCTAVQIAAGEVVIYRCTGCHDTSTRCVKCFSTVGGTRESEWLELKCRACGHETNIRKLLPPNQLRLGFPMIVQGGSNGKEGKEAS